MYPEITGPHRGQFSMGSADFKSLEDELALNEENDTLYWQQNDAKLRAVKSVSTYQEFSDIVKAAHLRPLTKKEIAIRNRSSTNLWNNVVHTVKIVGKQNAESVTDVNVKPDNYGAVCSLKAREFIGNFHSAECRYRYLSVNGPEHVSNTFRDEEIPPSVLVEILETLLLFPSDSASDVVTVTSILEDIACTNRFELTVGFLSSVESKTLNKLFDKLEECLEIGPKDSKEQKLTRRNLSILRNKYKI